MNKPTSIEINLGSKTIRLETGMMALQAAGSVTIRLGDTILLSAVTAADSPREGIDYFPLQVEYREKYYAAGKFPGGFFKREARPSEKEVLTARFTDRPIRPLFQEGFFNEVQINNTLLSADGENDSDILSITAASAALTLSELPFIGPIGAVRVGRVRGEFIINPTNVERLESDLDLIYAGNREIPIMIEGCAKEIKEADLLDAMRFAHAAVVKIIDGQLELRRLAGLPDKVITTIAPDNSLLQEAEREAGQELLAALGIIGKSERRARVSEIKAALKEKLLAAHPDMSEELFRQIFDKLEIKTVRKNMLQLGQRIGGRARNALRPLAAQVGLLPRVHGSALFSRGETQALGAVTLGSQSDAQALDMVTGGMEASSEKKFMVHYNFPPYSVGEVGRLGSTNRRELGHGALAERSLEQVMPADYPYTVRLVSEIMGSNGSSSMASVCVGTLALMDAGVPITKPVAGISIGLFSDEQQAVLVTDIIGEEDHCGDMDFKVAGTRDGITGFQVDLKMNGLPWEVTAQAFEQARKARLELLDFMAGIIAAPRAELSPFAPRITVIKINPEKIGELIGPGGKNIRRITELSKASIDIEDDGTVHIFSTNAESMELATREVSMITAEAEEGKIYDGKVTGIKEFGAFVEILPGKDGLVHISELADFRVNNIEDVCKLGDQMWVKCIGIDDRGRVKLSRRAAMQEKGLHDEPPAEGTNNKNSNHGRPSRRNRH